MTLKVTTFFEQITAPAGAGFAPRQSGWTESWYTSSPEPVALPQWIASSKIRANMLSQGANIVGARFEDVDVANGSGHHIYRLFPGRSGIAEDIPQMALLLHLETKQTNNFRSFLMRGIPDDNVKGGEFTSDQDFRRLLNAWLQDLALWQMRGEDKAQTNSKIISVTAGGLVKTFGAHGMNAGGQVNITRSKFFGTGKLFSGKFTIVDVPDAFSFNIGPLPGGLAATGGFARKLVVIYPAMGNNTFDNSVIRITTRRVGRPFDLYSGRHRRR